MTGGGSVPCFRLPFKGVLASSWSARDTLAKVVVEMGDNLEWGELGLSKIGGKARGK